MNNLRLPPPSDRNRFEAAEPWPHLVIDDMMPQPARDRLAAELAKLPFRWRRVREEFYEHEVCNFVELAVHVGGSLAALVDHLGSSTVRRALAAVAGMPEVRLEAVTGHRLLDGDSIGLHSDASDERSSLRLVLCAATVAQFEGGAIELYGEGGSGLISVPYVPGRGFLFRLSASSWHAVSAVRSPGGDPRFTVVATYGKP